MNIEKIKALLEKYYEGKTSLEEEQQLRSYFNKQEIPDSLKADADLFKYYETAEKQDEAEFNPFAKIEARESIVNQPVSNQTKSSQNNILYWSTHIAAGVILLIIGFWAGQLFSSNNDYASTEQVAALQQEVKQMKNALMNNGNYQTASAGERLSAVNLSSRIPANDKNLDQQITDILVYTMNNDNSVNVRAAAAEALFRFRDDAAVQRALVNSLNQQDDPLMQITLIDMLVELKASGAINEMKKMLVDSDTQELVRQRLETGIAQLKA